MRRRFRNGLTLMLAGLCVLINGNPAATQGQGAPRTYERLSLDEIRAILQDKGYKTTVNGGTIVITVANKYSVNVMPVNNNEVLYLSCLAFPALSLEKVNEWNDRVVLSRATFLKQQNKTRLEADLDCRIGITDKNVEVFLKRYADSLIEFDAFTGGNPARSSPGIKQEVKIARVDFPLGATPERALTSWEVHYTTDPRYGLRIVGAWLKRVGESPEWIKVAEDLHVSQLYVPYSSGNPRFYDLDLSQFRDHAPWRLNQVAGANENLLGPQGKFLDDYVVREDRDAGLLWLYGPKDFKMDNQKGEGRTGQTYAARRQEMLLWGVFQASNYFYTTQVSFQNDGSIICKLGATGKNFYLPTDKSHPHDHMHNNIWRVQMDLGGSAASSSPAQLADENRLFLVKHTEASNDDGRAYTRITSVDRQQPIDWVSNEFTSLRIQNPQVKNRFGTPVAYDFVPLRYGSSRHFGPHSERDDFTQHDFWITNNERAELDCRDLPTYVQSGKLGNNPVIWHSASNLHIPRDEDYIYSPNNPGIGSATVMFSGFELRPRSVFSSTPFLAPPTLNQATPPAGSPGRRGD